MIASDLGLDYERIRQGLVRDYPRAADLAPAGFAAGPCLLKDTAGLARANAGFTLGRAAIAVNQGLPGYLISRLELRFDLAAMSVGVLGMAFKGGSDDTRSSLAYLLADLLAARAREVLCTDPLVSGDPDLLPLETCWTGRLAGDRRAPSAVPRPADRQAGRRHLEPAAPRSPGMTGQPTTPHAGGAGSPAAPRISVVVPARNEAARIGRALSRIFASVRSRARSSSWSTPPRIRPGGTCRPGRLSSRGCGAWSANTGPGRRTP